MPFNVGTLGVFGPLTIALLVYTGGFSYVYLVKELPEGSTLSASLHIGAHKDKQQQQQGADDIPARRGSGSGNTKPGEKPLLVVKVTSIHSRSQRDIAEKEAKLLSRLSHPSIIKMHDTCYQQIAHTGSTGKKGAPNAGKDRPQHLILMEYCEGGHALDVCAKLASQGQRFDLSTLIIAFGQICNAVSYLHAQRPPIVHRDLKPNNFLVKNGAYKLCDFGSAVFGHVDLRTPKARAEAEEVIQKTTTQMFRAPEMVDLFTAKKLTQA
jgi:serine/threonine protein kinase